jgi:hypothetical protein
MRRLLPCLGLALLLALPCFAQDEFEVRNIVDHPFAVDFVSGSPLSLSVRSGEVRIVGVEEERITIEISGDNAHRAQKLKVRFQKKDGGASMRIWGGPNDGITITVRIPAKTDLRARVPFGEVTVENVPGNKDLSLHAGELIVDVGDRESYSHVEASVMTGEVDASAFGENKGGLFRKFRRDGQGSYRLSAHVGAGQVTLK